jgi:hypothetical protein
MAENQNVPPTQYQDSGGILSSVPPSGSSYNPPPRWVTGASPGGGGGGGWYTGTNLVDENNNVTSGPYDITNDYVRTVYAQLAALPDAERTKRYAIMQKYGLISGNPNLYANQLEGIANLLDLSNTLGVTAERALLEIQKGAPAGGNGGGAPRRFRVSSPDDLKAVAKRVAQETIGRAFTDDEANQFVAAYQNREMQAQQQYYAGGVMTEAPSADVFAQQFAQQTAPTEADAYKFLGAMNRIFSATSGAM